MMYLSDIKTDGESLLGVHFAENDWLKWVVPVLVTLNVFGNRIAFNPSASHVGRKTVT